jgi:hypothetical protein
METENIRSSEEGQLVKEKVAWQDVKEVGKALGSWVITLAAVGAFGAAAAYGSLKYVQYEQRIAKEKNLVQVWPGLYLPRERVVKK